MHHINQKQIAEARKVVTHPETYSDMTAERLAAWVVLTQARGGVVNIDRIAKATIDTAPHANSLPASPHSDIGGLAMIALPKLEPREIVDSHTLLSLIPHTVERDTGKLSEIHLAQLVMILPDICGELLAHRLSKTPDPFFLEIRKTITNDMLRDLCKGGPERQVGEISTAHQATLAKFLTTICSELLAWRQRETTPIHLPVGDQLPLGSNTTQGTSYSSSRPISSQGGKARRGAVTTHVSSNGTPAHSIAQCADQDGQRFDALDWAKFAAIAALSAAAIYAWVTA